MTISEKIRILCVRAGINVSELARRVDQSPQNFNAKLKKGRFDVAELEQIADAVGCTYENHFIWIDGDEI
ncbi:MAG: helix-turn-helix transcriptional regulator [Defluviitaleaceae bacterium]|nr:helix-turn-helix transcriptional regulator [Defluviitaleaceae bacterium]